MFEGLFLNLMRFTDKDDKLDYSRQGTNCNVFVACNGIIFDTEEIYACYPNTTNDQYMVVMLQLIGLHVLVTKITVKRNCELLILISLYIHSFLDAVFILFY